MTNFEFIRAHLLQQLCAISGDHVEPLGHITLEEVDANRKQFDSFVELMNNRMRQGYFRYNRNEPGEPAKIKYFEHIKQCLVRYQETGNQENLVDAANSCRLEFLFPSGHPNPHFSPSDDEEHAEVL